MTKQSEAKEEKVLELIKIDEAYKKYFFRKVKDVKWFYRLKSEGHFDSENLPGPVQTESGGYQMPTWLPLKYLERLSEQIAEGEHHGIIEEIISIVREVSEKKVDNPHVWHDVINILANLPNEKIPPDIFDHVPTWLKTQFRNSLPSSELCQKLLPKFLPEKPASNDIQKAECIFKHILTLEKKKNQTERSIGLKSSYASLVDLYWLQHTLVKQNLIKRIGKYLSNKVVFTLSDNLKKLLLDFPDGITVSGKDYSIHAFIEGKDLLVKISSKSEKTKGENCSVRIEHFEEYNVEELTDKITKGIEKLDLRLSEGDEFKENMNSIARRVNSDYSTIWCNSVHKLGEDSLSRDELKMVQTLILRDLLDAKAKYVKEDFQKIVEAFLGNQYKLPLFRRLLLYAISENWSQWKAIFWEMVKNEDEAKYFSSSNYDKELYYLLKNNIKKFGKSEKEALDRIIKQGPQIKGEDTGKNYKEYWQLKWYSALKNDPDYKDRYVRLSLKLNLTNEDFEKIGEARFSAVGTISPYSVQEILEMEVLDLVQEILTFSTKDRWEGPSAEGFARTLEHAVKEKPSRFANDIHHFIDAYYIYIYHILRGFEEVWKENQFFDWEKVLNFCLKYVSSESFRKDELKIDDGRWNTTKETIIGVIGNLITEGTQNDSNAFDKKYLPIAEEILSRLIPSLEADDDYNETNMDYPTYSLNSPAGKLLRALLDYSLRKARIEFGNNDSTEAKWSEDIKEVYETALEKEIIDGYILLGMYFGQFNYLDREWLTKKVKEYYDLPKERWLAFMGGYTFHHAYKNQEIYELMLPHYQRAIGGKFEFERFGYSGLIRQIGSYYLWGFESISEGPLIAEFLSSATAEQISKLINFFYEIREHVPNEEKDRFSKRIVTLWKEIQGRFDNIESEEVKKVLSNLSKLAVFLNQIDNDNFDLLKSSAPYVNYDFNSPFFLEELNRLKDKGEATQIAKYIGEILQAMLTNFTPDYDPEDIVSLVEFLYQNKEDKDVKSTADNICAEYARRGQEFLRDLYNQNRN